MPKVRYQKQYYPAAIPDMTPFGNANTHAFCHTLARQILINTENDRNVRDGRVWMYNTLDELSARSESKFSRDQIKRITKNGVKRGILMKGNYNRRKSDRTCWYAFTDYGLELMELPKHTEKVVSEPVVEHMALSHLSCGDSAPALPINKSLIKEKAFILSNDKNVDNSGRCYTPAQLNKSTVPFYHRPKEDPRPRNPDVARAAIAEAMAKCGLRSHSVPISPGVHGMKTR